MALNKNTLKQNLIDNFNLDKSLLKKLIPIFNVNKNRKCYAFILYTSFIISIQKNIKTDKNKIVSSILAKFNLSNNDKILLLDGGNIFQGHPIGIVDSGRTMIEWMNKVGYHAMVPGNYDFLFGLDNLLDLSKKANFSFLSANLFYKNSNSLIFKPYEIIEFDDVTIGVIGIVNPNLENLVFPKKVVYLN